MFRKIGITLAYAAAVSFAPLELTRYILEWKGIYGEFPLGGSIFGQAHWEIVFIWSTYLVGVCLVAALLRKLKWNS